VALRLSVSWQPLTIFGLLSAFLLSTDLLKAGTSPPADGLAPAEDLYKHTEYEASLAMLKKGSQDAATDFLIGRDEFMLGDFKKSSDSLQHAVVENPQSGEYMDWLGRAYGRRAETSNPLLAPSYASKARQAFEQAVKLDPKNPDALSDLFDYYLDAPGFLGGGYDKAVSVAQKIAEVDPTEGYFEEAKLAQKRREFNTAERHLLAAVAAAPHKLGGLLTYAKFLASQGRNKESDAVLEQAQLMQPNAPQVWYTRADILVHQRRNLDEAKGLLKRYLSASLTVDDPSKEDAQRLLKQVGGA
jgi:tetratricopeptide (TPR) repeat protein